MSLQLRFAGPLSRLDDATRRGLMRRTPADADAKVRAIVEGLLARVRAGGDRELRAITQELDKVELAALEVTASRQEQALARLDGAIRGALERAIGNIERVHRAFMPRTVEVEPEPGVRVGRRPDPLIAAGIYAPGGRAVYPSSVLMGVVPARVAGVRDVIVCSPPGPDGAPSDVVLAAARLAGASRVFALGGAQAIAALAFGSETVPKVERIVGPGNAFVAEAKRQVAGSVGIDAPAGPSEILILADDSADPDLIVREMIAQAEHDPDASTIALVSSAPLGEAVRDRLASATPDKREIVASALAARGAVIWTDSVDPFWDFASEYAAEHLLLALREPERALGRIQHAGTVFFGAGASVAFGDYMTGANHVLPTAGAGRGFSGLSTLDFMRFTTYQELSRAAAASLSEPVARLADSEGLPAHARAARAFAGELAGAGLRGLKARQELATMRVYEPSRAKIRFDLSDNTNQVGPPPEVHAMLGRAVGSSLSAYPSLYGEELKHAVAARFGVDPAWVVTGCGSDDVLECALRAYAEPGERLAFPVPTFSMIPHFARVSSLVPCGVPLLGPERAYDADLDGMLAHDPRVLYLCSPNNPTGTLTQPETIARAVADSRGLVILDEAYIDYGGAPALAFATSHNHVLVTRTLSKAFGLAGMRVGFGIAHPDVVSAIEKVRGPYKLGRLAEQLAVVALSESSVWVAEQVEEVKQSRARFVRWLEERGASALPSEANFILLRVPSARAFAQAMEQRGVLVRAFPEVPGLGDCVRISVGPWPLMEQVLPALAEVIA